MNEYILREIVEGIIEAADEILAIKNRDSIQQGELIAYAESLCIIQDALAGRKLEEFGLAFDIDKKYLY